MKSESFLADALLCKPFYMRFLWLIFGMTGEKTGKNSGFVKKIASFELGFISKELNSLLGAKLQRVYQLSERDFLFDFHIPGKGRRYLRAHLPSLLFLSESKPPVIQNPPRMCSLLRKYLEGAMLKSISQQGFERIMRLDFASKSEGFALFFELFSRGNLILCSNELKIIGLVESQSWKDRQLTQGLVYSPPPPSRNPAAVSREEFLLLASHSEKELAAFLATELSLGGLYAEEACLRAGVDKSKKAGSLSAEEASIVFDSMHALFSEEPSASVVYDSGNAIDAVPIKLKSYSSLEQRQLPSFSSALDELFASGINSAGRANPEKERILRLISEQEASMDELLKKAELSEKKAGAIYQHYGEVREALDFLTAEISHFSVSEAFDKLKKFKSVKSFDKKERKITFHFE